MIRSGFRTDEERKVLTELARDGMAEHRLAGRANALVLLDDDTLREWCRLFERDGLAGFHGACPREGGGRPRLRADGRAAAEADRPISTRSSACGG
jgi:hypothetical protein